MSYLDLLRRVTELEAECERLRAQRNKAYAESDTNHAGMVAAQEDAMKMRERTRALEAALRHAVYRNHEATAACSACEQAQAALTEPPPRTTPPATEQWLRTMADAEDRAGSVSAGERTQPEPPPPQEEPR